MSAAVSTLGMTPARRRIFEAGTAAQAASDSRQAEAREAAMEARRQAVRVAAEVALAREEEFKRAAVIAAAQRHPVSKIIVEVAAKHNLFAADLVGESRLGHFVIARQEAMWRARNETNLSLPAIGRKLGGRDHTTVLHGIRRHQQRLDAASASRALGGEC